MILKLLAFLTVGLICFFNFYTPVFAKKQNKLRFCMVDSKHTHSLISNVCRNLVESKDSKVECIIKSDRVECLKLLINDKADFMSAEPEDLIVLSLNKEYNNKVLVTHELRIWENENSNYKAVIVVRKDIENLWHTENRHLCLPGFEKDSDSSDYIKFLETKFVSSDCNLEKSLLENRLSALSQYFESACISGPWTSDHQLDTRLKKKYQNLCSRCENSLKCSEEDKFHGKEGVLLCLTEGGGDVAWTRLDFVRQHFKLFKGDEDYRFLCPDGSVRKLTQDPCIWFEGPWRTTIARKNIAERVSKFIFDQKNQDGSFFTLLEYDFRRAPISTETLKSPEDYLKLSFPDYYSLKDYLQCKPDRRLKWCVTSKLEAKKCKWLSYAANSYGIEPLIECVQETNTESCIDSVKNKINDIFVLNSIEEYQAKMKGLRPIVHLVTKKENQTNQTAAIVNKFSDFKFFKDLKNRKACFSGYRDIGWNTFIYLMRNLTGNNDWYCKDKQMVSRFFKESCVFNLSERNSTFPKNLYSLCSHIESNNINKTELNCLDSNIADVSFLNFNSEKQFSKYEVYYKTVCSDEIMFESSKKHECFLSWSTLGSIVANENISSSREEDILLLFMDLQKLFGENYQGLTPLISLYGPFEGNENILFPEFTDFLEADIKKTYHRLSYNEIIESFKKYGQLCNEADNIYSNYYIYFFIFLPLYFFS